MEYQLSVSWNEFEWLKVVIKNTFCGENFLLTLISNNGPCGVLVIKLKHGIS